MYAGLSEKVAAAGGGDGATNQRNKMADHAVWKAVKPYVNGGLSGMASTCVIQPLDSTSMHANAMRWGAGRGDAGWIGWEDDWWRRAGDQSAVGARRMRAAS